ncbi:hypothetical protein MMC13_007741 [Lambiella insularis]|nr:hypothetical protein [Lambiella insularis]
MRSMISLAALAALLTVSSVNADGIYSKGSAVLQVDGKSYEKLIKNSNRASIVEFYAPWCGHCQNLKPAYEKAAKSLEGLANVAAVNCDDESNKAFCGSMNIKGFPTLKTVRPTLHKGKSIMTDYNGARTAAAIVEAVKDMIPDHVKRVTDKDFAKWLGENNSTAKAILFSDKGTTSALIKVLASDFYGNMHFAQARDKDTKTVSTFGVTKYPTLVVLPGGTASAITYTGDMSKESMSAFLAEHAPKGTGFIPSDSKASKQKPMAKDKAASSSDSSTFSEASASYKSAEASEAAASGTTVTLSEPEAATASPDPIASAEDAPAPASMPDIAPPLPTLSTQTELQAQCLGSKTPTCILALLPAISSMEDSTQLPESATSALSSLSGISEKHKVRGSHLFPFFAVPPSNDGNTLLRSELGLLEGVQLIAVNGRRSWWRHFSDEKGHGRNEVEAWVDGIRLGEGKKSKLPSGLVADVDTEGMTEAVESATSQASENAESATSVAASSAESMTDAAKAAGSSATDAAGSAVSGATASVQSAASDAADSAKSVTDSAGSSIGSVTSLVAESVASAASAASEKAGSATSIVGEFAASGASQASSAASSVTSAAADSAASASDAGKDAASGATSVAADKAATAASSISSVSDKAASAASSATSNVGSAASSVSASAAGQTGEADHLGEKVGKKVDSMTEKVGEKVDDATDVVKEKVGQATDAAKAKKEGVVHGEL